jgi:ABC-type proline/glycine betaine transport system substrate-binding protein
MLEHVKITQLQRLQLTDLGKHAVTSVARQWVSARQAQTDGWIKG